MQAVPQSGYFFLGWLDAFAGRPNPFSIPIDASTPDSVQVSARFLSEAGDEDGDGLSNSKEVNVSQTDPFRPDSDGDGLGDGVEVNTYKSNPLLVDSDGDALLDGVEVHLLGTSPVLRDSDGDGLWDGLEDADGDGLGNLKEIDVHKTSPVQRDTDGDGLDDGDEVNLFLIYDPTQLDTDGNGLTDGEEDADGDKLSNRMEIRGYMSDPKNPDTDGDGLMDGEEVNQYRTNLLVRDTDGDGLSDLAEVRWYVGYDPLKVDSDGDGIADGDEDADGDLLRNLDEQALGTDPVLADTDGDGLGDGAELGHGLYQAVLGRMTWEQARVDALARGGSLATVATRMEWELLFKSLGGAVFEGINGLWIGATDREVEGQWKWLDGIPLGFSNWAAGEPDNLNDSDYAAIAGELAGTIGQWNDFRAIVTRDGYVLRIGHATDPLDPDSDDDGLDDARERVLGTHPRLADSDGDGLSDREEVELTETLPLVVDSDGNGVGDGEEDADQDGLSNQRELRVHGTHPLRADSDGDGLRDGDEVRWFPSYNPLAVDTDGDGTGDGAEDPDGDGLDNQTEIGMHRTDPWLADTDGDGLGDGEELSMTMTDPVRADSDGDGISDGDADADGDRLSNREELRELGTDPRRPDSDGDAVNDGLEVRVGWDPLKADGDLVEIIRAARGEFRLADGGDLLAARPGSVQVSGGAGGGPPSLRLPVQQSRDLVEWWESGEEAVFVPVPPQHQANPFYRFGIK